MYILLIYIFPLLSGTKGHSIYIAKKTYHFTRNLNKKGMIPHISFLVDL